MDFISDFKNTYIKIIANIKNPYGDNLKFTGRYPKIP